MIVESLIVGLLQVNCYILGCEATRLAVVIDPGDEAPRIARRLQALDLRADRIINTHAHFDHLMGVRELKSLTAAPFYLHQAEIPLVAGMRQTVRNWLGSDPGEPPAIDGYLVPGETVTFGREVLELRWTPGHSPGSITFVDHAGRRAIVGDALFAGSIGRTDLPGGNMKQLLASIQREILTLPADFRVLPGHGPATTVGIEKLTNPFLAAGDDDDDVA